MVIGRESLLAAVVFYALSSVLEAQELKELTFIMNSNPVPSILSRETTSANFNQSSEVKFFLLGGIRMYQLFLSSQDMPVCIFTPSCSRFGMKAIQTYGIIRGTLLTSDRLQRCNGLAIQYYPIDRQTGKAIDPVEKYSFD